MDTCVQNIRIVNTSSVVIIITSLKIEFQTGNPLYYRYSQWMWRMTVGIGVNNTLKQVSNDDDTMTNMFVTFAMKMKMSEKIQ